MRPAASLFAAGLVQLAASAACRPQYCRSAILAAGTGIDDCNAFLLTTVILPTETDYSTPTSAVTKTKTHTFSETETDSYTASYQPSVVIWSTYTSVDVINSVTHTTKKKITTTTSPKFTQTTTTALSTTTLTSTITTTTQNNPFRKRLGSGPEPTTVTNSVVPDYASMCSSVPIYTSNCLDLGATRSATTISPPIDSEVLSSTLVSTASADVSEYVSTTITKTTTKTLPSLHSTRTVESTTTRVISTSTSTTYTKTKTKTSKGITTATIATTTTTTTVSTASPTPYLLYVTGQGDTSGYYIDWVTPSGQSPLRYGTWTDDYALGFCSEEIADNFIITSDGYLATIVSSGDGNDQFNTPLLLTINSSGYVIPMESPPAGSSLISCSITSDSSGNLSLNCDYYLYSIRYTSFGGSITLMAASTSSTVPGVITLQPYVSTY